MLRSFYKGYPYRFWHGVGGLAQKPIFFFCKKINPLAKGALSGFVGGVPLQMLETTIQRKPHIGAKGKAT